MFSGVGESLLRHNELRVLNSSSSNPCALSPCAHRVICMLPSLSFEKRFLALLARKQVACNRATSCIPVQGNEKSHRTLRNASPIFSPLAGFNSSVPRTFTFLEDPTPKRRGSALEREEMASLTQETSPTTSGGYLFPDEESPRRPVADTNDQSWAHVRTAVAQAKRSRSMGAGSPRDGNGSAKTAGRNDPMR